MSAAEQPDAGRAGRSTRPRRQGPGPVLVLAVVLPLVLALAAVGLRPRPTGETDPGAPAAAALTSTGLSCPGPADGTTVSTVGVSTLADPGGSGGSGDVAARTGAESTPVEPVPGQVTAVAGAAATGAEATLLQATGGLAAGLTATRSVASPLAATPCRTGASEQWFTGAGAAAEHSSVIELANTDAGPAVAEITVYSSVGIVDVPALRGLAVPAGTTSRVDLSQVVPRRGDLGLRVQVTRGRLGVAVLDRQDPLTGDAPVTDWLGPQAAPATTNLLLGLARGTGASTLGLSNPSRDEVSVGLQVLTRRTTYQPAGLDEVRVPPGSTVSVGLDSVLDEAARRGAVGVIATSTGPVTASLRQVTDDLSLLVPVEDVDQPTALVVPAGQGRLQLAGARVAGTVAVVLTDASGSELVDRSVKVRPGAATAVALPPGTALVRVDPGEQAIRGAVVVRRPGQTVLPMLAVQRSARVPQVAVGLR